MATVGVAAAGVAAAMVAWPGCATRATNKDADQAQIRYQLAVDYFRAQRTEAALEEVHKALAIDPDSADAYDLLGLIALSQGADYLRQVETASCLRGADAVAVRRDAAAKFKEAEQHLRKATVLRPTFAEAWNNLSVAALQLGNYAEASTAAANALKDVAYPSPELARANLGWAEFHRKKLNGAWKALHEAVAHTPGFCVGRYRLAKVYVERGQYDEAAEEVDAVTANPACPIQEAFLLAGMVHQRRKDGVGVRPLLDRCVSIAPRACLAVECKRYAEMLQ
ncbi:MAG: tetratricopeptide repeat protein [Deltaproteobacteria bacterium]|nr:tetratricopeptide repeat protein [Deltaproteobacteria bacterium]